MNLAQLLTNMLPCTEGLLSLTSRETFDPMLPSSSLTSCLFVAAPALGCPYSVNHRIPPPSSEKLRNIMSQARIYAISFIAGKLLDALLMAKKRFPKNKQLIFFFFFKETSIPFSGVWIHVA